MKKYLLGLLLLVSISFCKAQADSSGSFTPVIQAFNVAAAHSINAYFTRVGKIVTVSGKIIWQTANSTGQGAILQVSLPLPQNIQSGVASGTFVEIQSAVPTLRVSGSFINQSSNSVQIQFNIVSTTNPGTINYFYMYQLP